MGNPMRYLVMALLLLAAGACGSTSTDAAGPQGESSTSTSSTALPTSTIESDTTTSSVEVATTTTEAVVTTTVPATTTTAPPSSTTTTTIIPRSEFIHVAATYLCVLGWWDGTRWVAPSGWPDDPITPPPVEAGASFDVANLTGTSTAIGGLPIAGPDEFGPAWMMDLEPAFDGYGSGIAVSGGLELHPRPVRELRPESLDYTADTAALLADLGLAEAPVKITRAVAVDLDGDGTDEVVYTAEHPDLATSVWEDSDEYSPVGFYNLLAIRQDVGGSVDSLLVYQSTYTEENVGQATSVFPVNLNAIADLNGDGSMEIVVDGSYYEGVFASVFEYDPRTPQPDSVLSCWRGA